MKPPGWTLVLGSLSAFRFIQKASSPENELKSIKDLKEETVDECGVNPFSNESILAFAYLAIVYPKSAHVYGIPNSVNISAFKENKKSRDSKELIFKLRNSLAHSDFVITHSHITFNHRDWRAEIEASEMVEFIRQISVKFISQHYIGKANIDEKQPN